MKSFKLEVEISVIDAQYKQRFKERVQFDIGDSADGSEVFASIGNAVGYYASTVAQNLAQKAASMKDAPSVKRVPKITMRAESADKTA